MFKIKMLRIFLILTFVVLLEVKGIENSFDYIRNIYFSNHIIPYTDEKGNLYAVTGEYASKDGSKEMLRNILKYNSTTGDLYKNITYYSNHFSLPEILFFGNNSEYLLTTTQSAIEFFNGIKTIQLKQTVNSRRTILKKFGSNLLYIYPESNKLFISNISINKDEGEEESITLTKINHKEDFDIVIISCDTSKDDQYLLCTYYTDEKSVKIVRITEDLNVISSQIYETSCPDVNYKNNYFIKIMNFRDLHKFALLYYEKDYTIRMRYFEYKDDDSLENSFFNCEYLDINNALNSFSYNHSDAMTLDSDKIIIVYAYEKVIVTLVQFHKNYLYSIRNFNFPKYQFNFLNPRLAMFRNSITICVSNYNNRVGFIFIGYPYYMDKTVTDNSNIKIRDLARIDNNIFFYELQVILLNIPDDFIFTNDLGVVITPSMYLHKYEELVFRQYKKKTKVSIAFESSAIGEYDNYWSYETFPENSKIPSSPETSIKAKKGIININIDECNNGFHEIQFSDNICTNKRPEGYYLDEQSNMYKKCHPLCSDCSMESNDDSNMNCLVCVTNYTLDSLSSNCIPIEPKKKSNYKSTETKSFAIYSIGSAVIVILLALVVCLYCKMRKSLNSSKQIEDEKKVELNENKGSIN